MFRIYCSLIVILIPAAAWGGAIDPSLAASLSKVPADEGIEVIVRLKPGPAPSTLKVPATATTNRRENMVRVVRHLKETAERSRTRLKSVLAVEEDRARIRNIRNFWIFDGFVMTATPAGISRLAGLPEVAAITANRIVKLGSTVGTATAFSGWNLAQVRAPELWARGISGQGMVVASLDTGVDLGHPALASKWRGGTNSWFDPHRSTAAPYDFSGHGTAVTGLMVGGNTTDNQVGVAPDARWIAAKIFDDAGFSDLATIHAAFQWALDPDGDPATADEPDVVNNSWDLDATTGIYDGEFQADIDTLQAAGIAVVFSAGNQQQGALTNTSTSPGNNRGAFSVGADDSSGIIGFFSSRGPSPVDGSVYPVLAAPGINVHSTDLFGGYAGFTGTSFSAPHVAGAIALLKSALPNLTLQQLEDALKYSVVGAAGPDNTYGYGRLDAAKAYAYLALPGDVNGDGAVNVVDVLAVLNAFVEGGPVTPLITRNGKVTPVGTDGKPNRTGGAIGIGDGLLILQKALGMVTW